MTTERGFPDSVPTVGAVALTGHRGARGAILRHLKREGAATATALAAALECSLNAVRHHLRELELEGSVVHDRTVQGVGAPIFSYRLSQQGHTLFPDRYAGTVEHLLDHLVDSQGRSASLAVLQDFFSRLGHRLATMVAGVPGPERGAAIARLLDEEGFMASWEPSAEGGGTLTEYNCPHRIVAERFPEICVAEEAFLAQAFGGQVERRSRIAAGCGSCCYRITSAEPASERAS